MLHVELQNLAIDVDLVAVRRQYFWILNGWKQRLEQLFRVKRRLVRRLVSPHLRMCSFRLPKEPFHEQTIKVGNVELVLLVYAGQRVELQSFDEIEHNCVLHAHKRLSNVVEG